MVVGRARESPTTAQDELLERACRSDPSHGCSKSTGLQKIGGHPSLGSQGRSTQQKKVRPPMRRPPGAPQAHEARVSASRAFSLLSTTAGLSAPCDAATAAASHLRLSQTSQDHQRHSANKDNCHAFITQFVEAINARGVRRNLPGQCGASAQPRNS